MMKLWNRLVGLVALLVCPAMVQAQLPPDQALKALKVAEGLQVTQFAAEPMFVNPTCMDVDAAGRAWVCEAVNYRCKLRNIKPFRAEGDRIVILIDTDGDGAADEAKTFYQSKELAAPIGIAVVQDSTGPGRSVFVCQSPDILKFRDADGDLKADGPPTKFLSGFGGIDHDHGVHGILVGPDAKLYFSVGDQGVKDLQSTDKKGPKWSTNGTDCRAATIWRCNQDGTDLELIAHNFRNNYEPTVDSNGTVFISDNDDDGNQQTRICFVLPGGNYGYHPRGAGQSHWHEEQPGIVHKALRTYFGSPTGMCFYEGTLLPEKYRGMPLHTDAGPRHLRCYHLKAKGAGYDVEQEVMLESKDTWFRPSDVCVAPDGSLMVADWYDPGVGGHGMGDTTRGRIYRITPAGHKGYNVPKIDLTTAAGLEAALASPNLSTRAMAQDYIRHMPQADGLAIVTKLIESNNPLLKARALWMLPYVQSTPQWTATAQALASNGANDSLKILGLRMLDSFNPPQTGDSTLALDDRLVQQIDTHASPAVRRELLLLSRKLPAGKMQASFYDLAKQFDGQDHFYLASLNIAAGTEPTRRNAVLSAFGDRFTTWSDPVSKLVFELRPTSILPRLEASMSDPKVLATQRLQIVDILSGSDDPKAGMTLLKQLQGATKLDEVQVRVMENLTRFLPGKWSPLRSSPELKDTITKLLSTPETQIAALDLIAAAEFVGRVGTVSEMAISDKSATAVKLAATRTLGKLPNAEAVAALAKMAMGPKETAAAAVKAIGDQIPTSGEKPTTAFALKVLQGLTLDRNLPTEVRLNAIEAMTASNAGSKWLIEAKAKDVIPADLVAVTGRFLRNSPFQAIRNQAVIAYPAPGKIDPKKLPSIAELAQRKGDVNRGKQILLASSKSEVQCMKCHMVQGQGGQIGPDLSMIGKKASRENLIESILMPSKAIADQFMQNSVETSKGQIISGMVVSETETTLTLRDANGRDTSIELKDIEERKKLTTTSLMPENLVATLTPDELVDLVEYVMTLKTASLTPDAWQILGPFENSDDTGLETKFAPEKSPTIDYASRAQGKSGVLSWKTIRPGEGGYVDLAAYHGINAPKSLSYMVREIDSAADQDGTILMGSDDGAKVFVNGQQVHVNNDTKAAAPAQHTFPVKLKKGRNLVMVKVTNGSSPHGFYLTLLAEQELKALPLVVNR